MNESLKALVTDHSRLIVHQKKEWAEIIVNWETVNKYEILDENKNQIGFIAEKGGGFFHLLKRLLFRSHRGFEIDIFDRIGAVVLKLSRSFFWFFSDLDIIDSDGEKLGSIHRRWGILHKKYDLRDSLGQTFARIKSPIWRLWTFPVEAPMSQAMISKRWGGALREVFTDADSYMIDFKPGESTAKSTPWTNAQRAIILSAAVSIDFDFFEENQGSNGVFDLFSKN